ncbi:MAG: hypothetical protein WBA31_09000 [Candidatus Dormiibacterota bacterium]
MERSEEDPTEAPAEASAAANPPPEFLNPESPRYQPWAEKQITNAVKEKRPLKEFLADFDARVVAYGDIGSGTWDPQYQERLLAKFASPGPGGGAPRRRRRRRPSGTPAGPPAAGRGPNRRPPGSPGQAVAEPGSAGERRRRRRRRPRGGRRPPEAGSAT